MINHFLSKELSKKILETKIIIIGAIFISGTILFASGEKNVGVHVTAFLILVSTALVVSKFNLLHPLCWFSLFFFLYSCSYSILFFMGLDNNYGYAKEPLVYQWLFLSIVLLILPTEQINVRHTEQNEYPASEQGKTRLLDIIYAISVIYVALSTVYLMTSSGYADKDTIYSKSNIFIILSFKIEYLIIILFSYRLYNALQCKGGLRSAWLIGGFAISILFSLTTGERNYMFQIALITVFLLIHFQKISTSQVFFLVCIGIAILPLTHMYKYYFLSGTVSNALSSENLIGSVLQGEFESAGRNL